MVKIYKRIPGKTNLNNFFECKKGFRLYGQLFYSQLKAINKMKAIDGIYKTYGSFIFYLVGPITLH